MMSILRKNEGSKNAFEVFKEHMISEQRLYRWKRKYTTGGP